MLPIDKAMDSWENIHGRLNNHENQKSFPLESFAVYSKHKHIIVLFYIAKPILSFAACWNFSLSKNRNCMSILRIMHIYLYVHA